MHALSACRAQDTRAAQPAGHIPAALRSIRPQTQPIPKRRNATPSCAPENGSATIEYCTEAPQKVTSSQGVRPTSAIRQRRITRRPRLRQPCYRCLASKARMSLAPCRSRCQTIPATSQGFLAHRREPPYRPVADDGTMPPQLHDPRFGANYPPLVAMCWRVVVLVPWHGRADELSEAGNAAAWARCGTAMARFESPRGPISFRHEYFRCGTPSID